MLSPDDYERVILALLTHQPLAEADRRALILELVAARRRALDTPPAEAQDRAPGDPPRERWTFVAR